MIIRFPKNSIIRVIRVICVQDKQRIGLITTTDYTDLTDLAPHGHCHYTDYKRISQRLNSKPKIVNSKQKKQSSATIWRTLNISLH